MRVCACVRVRVCACVWGGGGGGVGRPWNKCYLAGKGGVNILATVLIALTGTCFTNGMTSSSPSDGIVSISVLPATRKEGRPAVQCEVSGI